VQNQPYSENAYTASSVPYITVSQHVNRDTLNSHVFLTFDSTYQEDYGNTKENQLFTLTLIRRFQSGYRNFCITSEFCTLNSDP
jgi:hypothetical protein